MKIQVRYFAVFRERLGRESETLSLPDGADVAAALALLSEQHEPIRRLTGRFRTAVNHEMVPARHVLADGDELALIPPVAGGAPDPVEPDRDGDRDDDAQLAERALLVDGPLSVDRCAARVMTREMGGLVTFTGAVRRHSRGVQVERLEYEAYGEMAEKVMRALIREIEAEVAGARLAVEHRVGTLAVGDVAVVIAAAAPHRAEAFAACRLMIDRLKERVPIWKKEVSPDGAEWVGLGP